MDVQSAPLAAPPEGSAVVAEPEPDEEALAEALDALGGAERPLVLAGGGIRAAHAAGALRKFIERTGLPVVSSLMAVDALPGGHPQRVGMIGTYGNRWANMALAEADCLLVLGSRLDIRQTGADTDAFKGDREIFHVDCDPAEVNNRVKGCRAIEASLRPALESLSRLADGVEPDHPAWLARIAELRQTWPDTAELRDVPGINPNRLMHELSAAFEPAAYVTDVGQHQMWAAQSLDLGPETRFVTSGGMGSMGFGLPAAVGVSLALEGPVVLIAGDGGFQPNIQELETVARNSLALKMIVIDNACHGMVRQFQETYFEGRYQSTYWGYSAPEFPRVAAAYGIESDRVSKPAEVQPALERMWGDPDAPYLLEIEVDTFANAYPKIAFGRPISEMEPFAQPIGLETT
jgi:acetolactate synthase-1/2/3 large subunit